VSEQVRRKLKAAMQENARLQAEVERLTKAGDELWEFAKLADTNAPKALRKALNDWNAAKEGKQS
jgi:regulator of replication initiation timing